MNKQLKIAIDYDETFTADIELFSAFIILVKAQGHIAKFVTYRNPDGYMDDIKVDAMSIYQS